MIRLVLNGMKLWDKYVKDEMTVYAAQASFFIVLAFFPFIMLLMTLVQFIPAINKSDVLSILVRIMPDMLDALVVGIVDDLYIKSPATILSITGLLALWSAARGMMSIERGLNRILGETRRRNYVVSRVICAFYTLIFMIACIVSIVLLIFGNTLQLLILKWLPMFRSFTENVISLRTVFAIVLFLFAFCGLYTILPNRKQNPGHQIPGAAFTAVCWLLFSYAFSVYFSHFSSFSYMYGSLTAIMLLMLWLYFCICILFLGAEINYALEEARFWDSRDDRP